MNCLSLNIRGVGDAEKVKWVRRLKEKHKVSFIGLQETQILDYSRIDVNGCWDSNEFDFEGVGSNEGNLNLVNVYGPQSRSEKKKLWEDLTRIRDEKQGYWIVFGDFNVVRYPSERCHSRFCPSSAYAFNKFIQDADLKEFNMGGEKFTSMSRSDAKLSKLDRFLVCSGYLNSFPLSAVTAHPRELSDHSPITLQSVVADFGPIPFKLFNSWILKEGFDKLVIDTWSRFVGYGTPDAYLAAKLKFLKNVIRKWRKEACKRESKELDDLISMGKNFEKQAEIRPLTALEIGKWNEGIKKIE
ncbi:uncharacterized protein LOC111881667 [Lactuca sativa]|uniref:uncharacterized protein LOC111881667 n=1 Tax=Lactuca sativa TaxID=4236 RepID=UPI000CD8DA1B|nr:uncharacterized protein LOC111881667 [Lactuca sativa]